MTRQEYDVLEQYMLSCICDSAHDAEHIYRVLYAALDIAEHEKHVDYDVLIPACFMMWAARNSLKILLFATRQ